MNPNALPAATVEAAIETHGSLRAAARALGRPESTLRGILKRAAAEEAEAEAVAEQLGAVDPTRPNRAQRRAMRPMHPHYRRARRITRPLRRAFGGWQGAYRPTPWGRV